MTEAAPRAQPVPTHAASWPAAVFHDRRTALGIAVAALLVQAVGHQNGDNSWFLTFAEHVIDGATPYVDIGDPNLPLAFLIYVPAVLIGRLFGLAPEAVLVPLVFAGVVTAVGIAARILRDGGGSASRETTPMLCAAAFALLFLPAFCFAEREHVALLLLVPLLAVFVVRAIGGPVAIALALLAGVGGGFALAIKPHYALAVALPLAWVLWRRRALRLVLAPEIVSLATVTASNAAAVFILCPAYVTEALPLALDVYAPARAPLATLMISPLFIANMAMLIALAVMMRRRRDDRVAAAALASFGFLLTFLIQGKGWINHAYPGLALAVLALTPLLSRVPAPRRFVLYVALPFVCVSPFLCGLLEDIWSREEYPGLTAAVLRIAPPHPTIMGLAEELDVVHPLVRQVNGHFAGRLNCLWVTRDATYLLRQDRPAPARAEALRRFRATDEAMFAEDVRANRPDLILSESPALVAWSRTQPALAHVLDGYRSAEAVGEIEIWIRQP